MKKNAESVEFLKRRRRKLLRKMQLPKDGLPGSLSVSRYRCGKSNCRCSQGKGHEKWTLTYMRDGAKRVKHIPAALVELVRQRVEEGKTFKEEVNEVFGANAELLLLLAKENKRR